jgi:PKHD-type hydroxylase
MFWFENPNDSVSWDFSVLNALNDNDIEYIENYVKLNQDLLQPAEIRTAGDPIDNQYRRTDILWLHDTRHFDPIYKKVVEVASTSNNAHFKYALNYLEPLQYSVYREEVLGYYNIHTDNGLRNPKGFNRKLSFSILLNDPSEFDGGKLCYHYTEKPVEVSMTKGEMVLFPSYMPHSVQPVTRGVRKALVGWMCGPNFV